MMRVIDKIAEGVAVACFAISSAFVLLNVLNRYIVLGMMRDWAKEYENLRPIYLSIRAAMGEIVVTADEVPGLLLVWVSFMGAYIAMRNEGHISFTLVVDALPKKIRQGTNILVKALIIAFLGVVFWESIRMILVSGATEIETAKIAQGYFMAILPLSAVLLAIAILKNQK